MHWLNPGYSDQNELPHADYLGIVAYMLSLDSSISIRNGKKNLKSRVQEIKDYLFGWANSRNLICEEND